MDDRGPAKHVHGHSLMDANDAVKQYDLSCPQCSWEWVYTGSEDPDVAGVVCPHCNNDDITIEEDDE